IKLSRENPRACLPPGAPFKRRGKKIIERRQHLTAIVVLEDPAQSPSVYAVEPRKTDCFGPAKPGVPAANGLLVTMDHKRHGMEPRKGLAMRITDESARDSVGVA